MREIILGYSRELSIEPPFDCYDDETQRWMKESSDDYSWVTRHVSSTGIPDHPQYLVLGRLVYEEVVFWHGTFRTWLPVNSLRKARKQLLGLRSGDDALPQDPGRLGWANTPRYWRMCFLGLAKRPRCDYCGGNFRIRVEARLRKVLLYKRPPTGVQDRKVLRDRPPGYYWRRGRVVSSCDRCGFTGEVGREEEWTPRGMGGPRDAEGTP